MRSHVVHDVAERTFEVLKHCSLVCFAVVKRNIDFEKVLIACFANVVTYTEYKPQRVIVKVGTDVRVSAFGKRLELMVCGTIFKLCSCNIIQAFADTGFRQLVRCAEHVLGCIAESETASDTAFKVAGRTCKVVCNNTLVLIPDRHTVEFFIVRFERKVGECLVPESFKFIKCFLNGVHCCKFLLEGNSLFFVD